MKNRKQKRKNFFSRQLFLQKNCKGELTTQQIVILIILITSFAVILFLLFRLNLGELTDKEICHNSVVMKEKSVIGGNLDCKTNYICISGGGECKDFNPTITVKIDASNKETIMKAIAEEMINCWWMFGEGKINYLDLTDFRKVHCAICSVIKFDEEIQDKNEINNINYEELYNFLLNNNYDLESFETKLDFSGPIDTFKKYSIVTGINKGGWTNIGEAHLPVYFVKSDELTSKINCEVFDITKA
jgi:hypothetical protein